MIRSKQWKKELEKRKIPLAKRALGRYDIGAEVFPAQFIDSHKEHDMKKITQRVTKSMLLILLLFSLYCGTIQATQGQIDEVQDNIEELEEKKEEAEQQAESLSESANNLTGDLKELNDSLSRVTTELNDTEEQLDNTRKELEETRTQLEAAKVQEQQQYEAMKKRIQFLYEMDTDSLVEILMESNSIVDFLNRSEYIVSIHEYDRSMLETYRTTKEQIAQKEQELESKEAQLAALQQQETEKKQELSELINSTSQKLASAKEQIAAAKMEAEAYEAEIERQKEYEAQLEAQKVAEDAARLEEIRQQEEELRQNTENQTPIVTDASDQALLAALIQCEAGGESYEGKLAVGSVVINRVRSSYFPDTIAGVIYQSGQFSPVASGRFATVLAEGADESCMQAANEVLGGRITVDCLYFRRNTGTIDGIVIGNHVFY